jgi:LysR family hydrogen peroxide-inducible transcriptional activator
MLPSLRQLRFLVALADELHFSRAAEVCNVTQSTLSTGMKELENTLGVALAERTKRSVIMTPVGREIAERARALIADARDLADLAARHAGALRGDLLLGAIPTIGPFLIPRALPTLRRTFPDLRVYLLPFETGDLTLTPLFEDGYQLATPPGHVLAAQPLVRGADLEKRHLLLLEKGHCLQRHALSAFPETLLHRDESFAATSLSTLIAMVENGLGMTLLPELAIDGGVARGSEVQLTPLAGARPRQVVLAWRPTSVRGADFATLAEIFRTARSSLARGKGADRVKA